MGFGSEHLDEQAQAQAMKQKTLVQQAAAPTGSSATGSAGTGAANGQNATNTPTSDPIEGMLIDPIKAVVEDVADTLGITDFLKWIGVIQPTEEERAKAETSLRRYQQLNSEQQQYARERFEQEQQRKKAEEEARQQAAEQEQAAANQGLAVPTGTQHGFQGMGGQSNKQQTQTMLQQQRQSFNSTASAN